MHYSNAELGSDVNIDLDVSLRVHYGDQYHWSWVPEQILLTNRKED